MNFVRIRTLEVAILASNGRKWSKLSKMSKWSKMVKLSRKEIMNYFSSSTVFPPLLMNIKYAQKLYNSGASNEHVCLAACSKQ